MLIIAMPKSASASLLRTLSASTGFPGKQRFFPEQQWPTARSFDALARFHSDIREITAEQAATFTSDGFWAKQHLVPTSNNQQLIGDQKFVLLTREPEQVVLAYRRWEATGESQPRIEFKGLESESDWLQRAQDIGLLDELRRFREEWLSHSGCLEITYHALLHDTDHVFDSIEDWFGLVRSARPVELARERYTRDQPPAPPAKRRWLSR